MESKIGILNYGNGNHGSIQRMINKVGGQSSLINGPSELIKYRKIILPGVGNFSESVRLLHKHSLWEPLLKFTQSKEVSLMGICLGMQLLCKHSEEGNVDGLSLVDAKVEKFDFSYHESLKVPHMGWNTIRTIRPNTLLPMDNNERRFYFVHSYKVVPNDPRISIGQCDYGGEFCAAIQQDNILGVQFHPEKSHRFGMALIKNFVEL